jgi:hypothetical protein
MMQFERPEEPPEFQEQVREAKSAVAEAIRAGESLHFDESLWREHKGRFARAQHSKCAFCEMSIVSHDSAVDHFAPKNEIWELSADIEKRGREFEGGIPNEKGRTRDCKIRPGYWWLVYDWRNYLVACSVCNSKWKGCYFPIKAGPRQGPPDPAVPEERLLLNPFDDAAPWQHFRFDEFGRMIAAPGSHWGQATLDTLGLDTLASNGTSRRESLRLHREWPARAAHKYARAFVHHELEDRRERADDALESLCSLGSIECDHAGMVRAIAEHVTGQTWDELMKLRSKGHARSAPDAGSAI